MVHCHGVGLMGCSKWSGIGRCLRVIAQEALIEQPYTELGLLAAYDFTQDEPGVYCEHPGGKVVDRF